MEIGSDENDHRYTNASDLCADMGVAYTYHNNPLGLVGQVKSGTTTIVSFSYDESGNRIRKVSAASGTTITPNSYYAGDGSSYERNIMAGSLGTVATSTYTGSTASLIYHHKDHLGGTHVESDASGTSVEYIIYTPFGGTLVDVKAGSYENDRKYTDKEKDEDTGLYYYGARYYNSAAGVFTAQDSVFVNLGTNDEILSRALNDPQSLNSYSYTRNNPINLTDPTGNCFWDFCTVETAAFIGMSAAMWAAAAALAVAIPAAYGEIASYLQGDIAAGNTYADIVMGSMAGSAIVSEMALPAIATGVAVNAALNSVSNPSANIQNVNVMSTNTGTGTSNVYSGPRDLTNSLKQIESGNLGSHTFKNNGNPLPGGGNYRAYELLDTPNWDYKTQGTSPERIIVDQNNGSAWYSPDHYSDFGEPFVQIK